MLCLPGGFFAALPFGTKRRVLEGSDVVKSKKYFRPRENAWYGCWDGLFLHFINLLHVGADQLHSVTALFSGARALMI